MGSEWGKRGLPSLSLSLSYLKGPLLLCSGGGGAFGICSGGELCFGPLPSFRANGLGDDSAKVMLLATNGWDGRRRRIEESVEVSLAVCVPKKKRGGEGGECAKQRGMLARNKKRKIKEGLLGRGFLGRLCMKGKGVEEVE